MRKLLLFIVLFCNFSNIANCQSKSDVEAVSLSLPIRNSLKFNRNLINPTFSFVRETNSSVSFYSKKQWVQFENAPSTYLMNYSSRVRENEAFAVGIFQQNYGLMTIFGGIMNFAHNIVLNQGNNLTFGLNMAVYQSGLNKGKIVSDDSELLSANYTSNFLLGLNPGINYGTEFLDLGLSINNLVLYNFGGGIIKEDPEKAIELHAMYTGYLYGNGFFGDSKFSGFLKTEIKKDKTVISGLAMLALKQGFWAQTGYNTLYGFSAGLGINLMPGVAIEYNFERGMGQVANMGGSHEFAIAYKFKNSNYYEEDESAFIDLSRSKTVKKHVGIESSPAGEEIEVSEKLPKGNSSSTEFSGTTAGNMKGNFAANSSEKLAAEDKEKFVTDPKGLAAEGDALQKKLAADSKVKPDAEGFKLKGASDKAQPEHAVSQKRAAQNVELEKKSAADSKVKAGAEGSKLKGASDKAQPEHAVSQKRAAQNVELEKKSAADSKVKAGAEGFKLKGASNKSQPEHAVSQKRAAQNVELEKKSAADSKVKAGADSLPIKDKTYKVIENDRGKESKLMAGSEAKSFKVDMLEKKTYENSKLKKDKEQSESGASLLEDEGVKTVKNISQYSTDLSKKQEDLLLQVREKVMDKQRDLDDLKQENQLSEKQIYKEPKAFKSVTDENNKLEALIAQLDKAEITQKDQIANLTNMYNQRLKKAGNGKDSLDMFYLEKINGLKAAQLKIQDEKTGLILNLENIKQATEIEKKNRIKRAVYQNDQNRYAQDVATLKSIKETTKSSSTPLTPKDFDFGESQTNMQVFKNIKNYQQGYYLVMAVHSSIEKRDKFLIKAFAAGCTNINFFYNVQTSRYYIYYQRFDDLDEAIMYLEAKEAKPYNGKMAIIKLEN
ncbi:PorP/SprF family type IX secretion system membrane protein [Flavobacterium humidisoli]|uniref:PorP/SprF family type IX secretion system membrane protein n=1 Tax=Flavobacterium humidisoli TaxID=2937442 RepID=A0ABY4M1X0_9FLAO|nr:type IX secretion system membrane protein PorP/SprF [Flavobacterium humidisoli]UPZ17846.1 PorP/SprF family type IX secretion system membrane protein [Flavobacterium humidisoli]